MRRQVVMIAIVFVLFGCGGLTGLGQAAAQEPGWYPRTFVSEQQRKQIEATPIEKRPYRPLHFYGNFVRRNYYRGNKRLAQRFNANNVQSTRAAATSLRATNSRSTGR